MGFHRDTYSKLTLHDTDNAKLHSIWGRLVTRLNVLYAGTGNGNDSMLSIRSSADMFELVMFAKSLFFPKISSEITRKSARLPINISTNPAVVVFTSTRYYYIAMRGYEVCKTQAKKLLATIRA